MPTTVKTYLDKTGLKSFYSKLVEKFQPKLKMISNITASSFPNSNAASGNLLTPNIYYKLQGPMGNPQQPDKFIYLDKNYINSNTPTIWVIEFTAGKLSNLQILLKSSTNSSTYDVTHWVNGYEPRWETGKTYQLMIMDDKITYAKF